MMENSTPPKALHAIVSGLVQGVFFRAWTRETALAMGLSGWVRNLEDGRVEILAEGPEEILEEFLKRCRRGPKSAKVENIIHDWWEPEGCFDSFEIKR